MADTSLHRTASWVLRDKTTKVVVCETFDKRVVDRLNADKYEAVPILQYLGEINAAVRST